MTRLLSFWIAHRAELASLLGQHVLLIAASTLVAVLLRHARFLAHGLRGVRSRGSDESLGLREPISIST